MTDSKRKESDLIGNILTDGNNSQGFHRDIEPLILI